MSFSLEVIAINLGQGIVLLDNDTILPISTYLDADGDECEPHDALVVVAGKDGMGWWAIDIEDFERSVH